MKISKEKLLGISFIAITLVGLTGCFGSSKSPSTTTDEKSRIVETTEFTLKIPREWDVMLPKDFSSDVPKETLLVLRNNVKNENFTAAVNIIKKDLQKTQDTLEFAKEVINRQKNGLLNYKQNKQDLTKITIGGKQFDSYTMAFEAKKDAESELVNFNQTYGTKGNFGYVITGSYSTKESGENSTAVQDIVKSFVLK